MRKISLTLLMLFSACSHSPVDQRHPASESEESFGYSHVAGFERDYDLNQAEDLQSLKQRFQQMQSKLKDDARPQDSEKGIWPLYFVKNEELSNKKLKKSFQFMVAQLEQIQKNHSPEAMRAFQEMNRALLLNFVPPLQDHYTVSEAAKLAGQDLFKHPFLKGKKPAQNLKADLWEEQGEISKKSLKLGFNRETAPLQNNQLCDYEEPKTGYGTRPGFTVKCNGKKVKIKFKEVHAEPFTSRIFWALGYHVEPVDYVPSVRVRYDRRIIDEFNSRKKMMIRVTALGKTVFQKPYAKTFDATEFMDHLVTKDGKTIPSAEIPVFLNEHEDQVAEVVTVEAQVQESNDDLVKVGPWSFNDFDHQDRREMRALVVLAAWLNWYDVRFDNNRVALATDQNGEQKLQLYIGDVGSAMGNVSKLIHFISSKIERADLFSDRFTTTKHGKFRIKNYFRLIDENHAFNEATVEDARWIGKKMLELKPEQLKEALLASGFSEFDAAVFQDKLLKRLEFMKRDLGL